MFLQLQSILSPGRRTHQPGCFLTRHRKILRRHQPFPFKNGLQSTDLCLLLYNVANGFRKSPAQPR